MKEKKSFLLQSKKEMNIGVATSGIGFLLYLAASAMASTIVADAIACVFGLIALYVWFSVMAAREEDKESVSFNLLWGQSALTLMLVGFAVLAIRMRLGL